MLYKEREENTNKKIIIVGELLSNIEESEPCFSHNSLLKLMFRAYLRTILLRKNEKS